jgi:MFS family permease
MVSSLRTLFTYPAALAVAAAFGVNSFLFGLWASRIPEVQQNLALGEGELGIALLGMPIGAVTIMPFMGWITERIGAGKALLLSTLGFSIAISLPPLATSLYGLLSILLLVGLTNGAMDISMNVAGTAVEKQYRVAILAVCHSFFSFGGMAGALIGSITAGLSLAVGGLLFMGGVLGLVFTFFVRRILTGVAHIKSTAAIFALPSTGLLLLAFIGFCVMLGEGAIADWSAVYLRKVTKASPMVAGLGYAGFSLAMGIGRLYGSKIAALFPTRTILISGSLTAAFGLMFALLVSNSLLVVAGFSITGLGYACLVPILYNEAVALPALVPGSSIAAIAGTGYVGLLLGPPLIGLFAEATSLQGGLLIVVLLALLAASCAMRVKSN